MMSRLLLGLVIALVYIGGTIVVSGATKPLPTIPVATSTEFSDCVVDVDGKYFGIRFYGLHSPAELSNGQYKPAQTTEPKCSLVSTSIDASSKEGD